MRLRTFVDVCRAVDFAHRNLIVHRDLKPSNIMTANVANFYTDVYHVDVAERYWSDAATRGERILGVTHHRPINSYFRRFANLLLLGKLDEAHRTLSAPIDAIIR
ncbi:MAG: hypothetical protein AAF511_05845 [Pseudomonadota bacterium]